MPLADAKFPNDMALVASLDQATREAFDKWLADLNKENDDLGAPLGNGPLEVTTGIECWFAYFEEGTSPGHAIDEEMSYD